MSISNVTFEEKLDTVLVISKPAIENRGEDSFYCAKSKNTAIVSVFDGCGGLGARKYDSYGGNTGAYMASRAASGAIRDWYKEKRNQEWTAIDILANDMNTYIIKALELCEEHSNDTMKIMGSMVRKFPTTMALAYAQNQPEGVKVDVMWAGDSRVYMLNENGLFQLTTDDTDVTDAMDNILNDAALTNVLSSDGKYVIHGKSINLKGPAMIFAATDGCFGYIPSPMEFEYTVVSAIIENQSPEKFMKSLKATLAEYAGDDFAMGIMSFFYGDFSNTRTRFKSRYEFLKNNYIDRLGGTNDVDLTKNLWEEYRSGYEKYMK